MNGLNTGAELEVFYENLMNKVKVSNEDYYQIIRPKSHANKYTHIQYNHLSGSNYICLDCDSDSFKLIDTSNIQPNLLVVNPDNNRGHFYFRINGFVGTTPNARTKPQKALRLLNHSLNNYLGTDAGFSGAQGKNPLYNGFRVFSFCDRPQDFNDIFDNIPEEKIYINEPQRLVSDLGNDVIQVGEGERTVYLFETIRRYSYRVKHKHDDYQSFRADIEKVYLDLNSKLANPMGYNDCKNAIKSISNWTWTKYDGSDFKNRGVMQLETRGTSLTTQEKQTVGAIYAAKTKRNATGELLQRCVDALHTQGEKVTQSAVQALSGKGIRTIKRYWKDLNK